MKKRIAILQPEVPHYRKEFFQYITEQCEITDIYVYNSFEKTKSQGFNIETNNLKHIPNINIKNAILLYNPWELLSKKYDIIVLMLHFCHITTWLLLLTKKLHKKKIILWGQGISVKRYLAEEKRPDWRLKWQIELADGVWLYNEPQYQQWHSLFTQKPMTALNNTLSGTDIIIQRDVISDKENLRKKYNFKQPVILIFCARFESNYRRTDLLIKTIEKLDTNRFGFIIIGAGKYKPQFSKYSNVYDFGAVYDRTLKDELFSTADIYFQPGWVGLSIVEAMAYAKPIFTFKRSKDTFQCVEYCYIEHKKNGLIFENLNECIETINALTIDKIKEMGTNARILVKEKLTPKKMATNAYTIIKSL